MVTLAVIVGVAILAAAVLSCIPTRKTVTATPEKSSPAGATFGPWATHSARCSCTTCR